MFFRSLLFPDFLIPSRLAVAIGEQRRTLRFSRIIQPAPSSFNLFL
ncbi:hypothetical protein PALU110988_23650 [Paenibacillus lupini]|nr:hypothetical protein [Paenibacillus lupini]